MRNRFNNAAKETLSKGAKSNLVNNHKIKNKGVDVFQGAFPSKISNQSRQSVPANSTVTQQEHQKACPLFANCSNSIKPLMLAGYEVDRSWRQCQPKLLDHLISFVLQEGYPEATLCSIFGNMPEDLIIALRAAWLSNTIVHRFCRPGSTELSSVTCNPVRWAHSYLPPS